MTVGIKRTNFLGYYKKIKEVLMDFVHKSVLLNECIEGLNIKKDGTYVDGTLGGAGHSKEIVKKLPLCDAFHNT